MYTHFVYSFVDGHLDWCTVFAVVNNAPMDIFVYVSVWVPALNSFGYIPRSEVAGSYNCV